MLLIVGLLVVIGSVLGGYMMHRRQVLFLNQPSEFLIIGGAAIGTLLISNADLLTMLYQLFRIAQQTGVMALESHFENPDASPILSKYPKFLSRHESVAFLGSPTVERSSARARNG
jgi:chemotaxis protein MotA